MRTIPLVYNPLQHRYLKERTPRDLILKPRQIGFTTCIQAEFRRYEWTRPASTMTLGKDDENTKELRRIADFFYDSLPDDFRPRRHYGNATLATYPGLSSRAVIATAGSTDAGRGGTRSHIHGSEVAFWVDAQKIMLGAMQAGSPSWIVLESTANGAQGWFFERCMDALDGRGVWKLHFYTWFDHDEYRIPLEPGEAIEYTDDEGVLAEKHGLTPEQINWRRFKIAEIGRLEDFLQEYPEDPVECFKKSGLGYFGAIDHVFKIPYGLEYDATHRYVAGLDFGQQQDYTVLVIIDKTTLQQVDMLRVNRTSWADIRGRIRAMCKKWQVDLIFAESNSIGAGQIEAMLEEFYADDKLRTAIRKFETTAVSKPPLMSSLYSALHEGGLLLLDDSVIRHEFGAAVAKQTARGWTVESPRDESGHGDTVIAAALAWHACGFV